MNNQEDDDLRQRGKAFRAEAGITDADLALLDRMSGRDVSDLHSESLRRMFRIAHYIYTPLFNALALHRQGLINFNSPVFRSFLQTFIGGGEDVPDLNAALPTVS